MVLTIVSNVTFLRVFHFKIVLSSLITQLTCMDSHDSHNAIMHWLCDLRTRRRERYFVFHYMFVSRQMKAAFDAFNTESIAVSLFDI